MGQGIHLAYVCACLLFYQCDVLFLFCWYTEYPFSGQREGSNEHLAFLSLFLFLFGNSETWIGCVIDMSYVM